MHTGEDTAAPNSQREKRFTGSWEVSWPQKETISWVITKVK
jgi:hypothetical protein